jgi:hypothetical protein
VAPRLRHPSLMPPRFTRSRTLRRSAGAALALGLALLALGPAGLGGPLQAQEPDPPQLWPEEERLFWLDGPAWLLSEEEAGFADCCVCDRPAQFPDIWAILPAMRNIDEQCRNQHDKDNECDTYRSGRRNHAGTAYGAILCKFGLIDRQPAWPGDRSAVRGSCRARSLPMP